MHCAQCHYSISYIRLKRQNKTKQEKSPQKENQRFPHSYNLLQNFNEKCAMVYIKNRYMPSLSWQIEMPVTNFCHQYLRAEAKPPEASTQVVGVWSVYGVLRHGDLEKSAFSNHWWIIGVSHIFSYITQMQITRDEASKATKAQRKFWKTDTIHNNLKWQVRVIILCKHTYVYCKQATKS